MQGKGGETGRVVVGWVPTVMHKVLVGVGNGTYDVDSIRPDVHEPVVVLLLDILRRKVQERLDIFDFLELGFAKGGKT